MLNNFNLIELFKIHSDYPTNFEKHETELQIHSICSSCIRFYVRFFLDHLIFTLTGVVCDAILVPVCWMRRTRDLGGWGR